MTNASITYKCNMKGIKNGFTQQQQLKKAMIIELQTGSHETNKKSKLFQPKNANQKCYTVNATTGIICSARNNVAGSTNS